MSRPGTNSACAAALLVLAAVVGCDQAAAVTDVADVAPPRAANPAVRYVGQGSSGDAARAAQRLVGAWIAAAADAVEPTAGGQVDARMNQALAEYTFRFEFQANGQVLIHRGVGPPSQGHWGITAADERAAVLSIAAPDFTADQSAREFIVRFGDDQRFTLTPADATENGLTMSFTRLAVR